ncbi:MAG: DUF6010 family protein [Caldilineaceae bacterium]
MLILLYLLLGVVLALLYIWLARRAPLIGEMANYTIGLIVAALIYVGFAVRGGTNEWLWLEILGVVIYGGVALLGLRGSPLLIALGWGAHPLWDAVLHPLQTTDFVPYWYAWACIGFDLMLAGYIVWHWWNRRKLGQELPQQPFNRSHIGIFRDGIRIE